MIDNAAYALTVAAAVAGAVRWLRIAQREHYIAGSVTRFAVRWWLSGLWNRALGCSLALGVAAAWAGWWEGAVAAAVISLLGPVGLSYRGSSSKLVWTRRLRTVAAVAAVLAAVVTACGAVLGLALTSGLELGFGSSLAALTALIVDLSLAATIPLERRNGSRFVETAKRRLEQISPRVVGITGSFGKTSTKFYASHLLGARYVTVASPASFNNVAGLSRAVNERLTSGTEVFVAEMGTYGPGEIRALCSWLKPEVSVITALGPVHLERMGSLQNIAEAKSEILEGAQVAVVNIDYPYLPAIAENYRDNGRLITCSTKDPKADVYVAADGSKLSVSVDGGLICASDLPGIFPGNLACAVGIAVAFDVPAADIADRLAALPKPEHRQTVQVAPNGVTVIDDTYNSNPDGARSALSALTLAGADHRRVLITPGMVELGSQQARANEDFARQAAACVTDIIIVGQTNRSALERGAAEGAALVKSCANRSAAVTWVRDNLGEGDAVLYENDLPDHYP
jgi:UDP-N-acetylmuramoyl-tripeptide--D-alanyl-D-alanine ligase